MNNALERKSLTTTRLIIIIRFAAAVGFCDDDDDDDVLDNNTQAKEDTPWRIQRRDNRRAKQEIRALTCSIPTGRGDRREDPESVHTSTRIRTEKRGNRENDARVDKTDPGRSRSKIS